VARRGEHVLSLLVAYADAVRASTTLRTHLQMNSSRAMPNDIQSVGACARRVSLCTEPLDQEQRARHSQPQEDRAHRGGFVALRTCLQDGYKAVVLGHLCLLGLTIYATQVEDDGRVDEVVEAYSLAVGWYNDALTTAQSIVTTGSPVGAKFVASYVDEVSLKHEGAEIAYSAYSPIWMDWLLTFRKHSEGLTAARVRPLYHSTRKLHGCRDTDFEWPRLLPIDKRYGPSLQWCSSRRREPKTIKSGH